MTEKRVPSQMELFEKAVFLSVFVVVESNGGDMLFRGVYRTRERAEARKAYIEQLYEMKPSESPYYVEEHAIDD